MNPSQLLEVLLLVGLAITIAAVARRYGITPALALVVAGVGIAFVPGVPDYALDPDVVLLLFLPPLLYSAALEASVVNIRRNRRAIGLLSVGLPLFTTVLVGVVAYAVVPNLGLPAAMALGAIVSPPDAVAATAIGRRLGLPRRMVTILAGESLLNDATALTAYRVAVAAATGATVSVLSGLRDFAWAAVGGIVLGLVIGKIVAYTQEHLQDSVVENAVSVVTPFLAYVLAEEIGASGVLSVVLAGLYVGHRGPQLSYATRLQSYAVWRMIDFGLESVVFLFIGLQLPLVIDGLEGQSPADVAVAAVVVSVVVILARIAWMFPSTYVPRLSARVRAREPAPGWRGVTVVAWSGMRGVVSLAAAFALPAAFPERPLLLFLTFVVVIVTLVLQGGTLSFVIRRLGVSDRDTRDDLAEAQAKHRAARASLDRLSELSELSERANDPIDDRVLERLREGAAYRSNWAWERVGAADRETPTHTYKRLRREMLVAEREVFVQLRDDGRLDEEVLRDLLRELDLEEAILDRE